MPKRTDIHRILIIGAGPIIISQACEFDYSGTQACKALKEEGFEVILVNSNPATIMTDPEFADATYVEPVDPAVVAAGTTYVIFAGMSQLFMAFEVVFISAFAGAQWTAVPAAIQMGLTAARVPAAMALVALGLGIEGVWIAIAGSTVLKGAILGVLFLARHGRK